MSRASGAERKTTEVVRKRVALGLVYSLRWVYHFDLRAVRQAIASAGDNLLASGDTFQDFHAVNAANAQRQLSLFGGSVSAHNKGKNIIASEEQPT